MAYGSGCRGSPFQAHSSPAIGTALSGRRAALQRTPLPSLKIRGLTFSTRLLAQQPDSDGRRETQDRVEVPSAAPSPSFPPPPPPPPPPEAPEEYNFFSRTNIALTMIVGGLLWALRINNEIGPAARDFDNGVLYYQTKAGNTVGMMRDSATGQVMMIDQGGNIYLDTGTARVQPGTLAALQDGPPGTGTGILMVTPDQEMYNLYEDERGAVVRQRVGNLSELTAVQIKSLGGVRLGEEGATILGFPDDRPVVAPAPIIGGQDGKLFLPPMIDEGEILLERKPSLNPFEKPPPAPKLNDLERSLT